MLIKHYIRISISLVALMLMTMFMADLIGLVPNEDRSRINMRIDLSESLAIQLSAATQQENMAIIDETIKSIVDRNKQIKSILLRKMDDSVISSHGESFQAANDIYSTSNHMKVPIFKDKKPWGLVEINFIPLEAPYLWGSISPQFFRLLVFITIVSFVLYIFLVKKILSHIDPYKVIPGRVKTALNALSEGVVLIDDDERIVLSNKSFENKTNNSADQLLGKKLSTLPWSYPDRTPETKQIFPWLKSISDGNDNTCITMNLEQQENDKITLIVNSTSLRDIRGKIRGAIISFNDVTELEKMNQDMESMMSFMRHETRNALLGASSTVSLLEKSSHLSDEDKQLLNRANKSHRVIKHLLDSVQEAKTIEATFAQEKPEPVHLASLIKEVVLNYQKIYTGNNFKFESDGNELIVLGQEERYVQMLDKLVSNAVDHSDVDTCITISCDKVNTNAVITVKNNGTHLPDDKEGIFDLFASFREKAATRHNQGIGLYVVKLIAEMYGGTAVARDSKDVTGAEFVITLPII